MKKTYLISSTAVLCSILSGLSACSPVSPSVSKMTSSSKSSSTESKLIETITNTETTEIKDSEPRSALFVEEKRANVIVLTQSEFDAKWEDISTQHPAEKISSEKIKTFSKTGKLSYSSQDKRVVGSEHSLINHSVNIYLVVKNLTATQRESIKNNINVNIAYDSASEAENIRINIVKSDLTSIADPVEGVQLESSNKMGELAKKNIINLGVEFLED